MTGVDDLAPGASGASAVTIGVYDGLHQGHRWVLRKLRRLATARGLGTVMVTFDPHPLQVLRPVAAPKLLTDLEQRLRLVRDTGLVDRCVVVHFDLARSRQSPESFVREVLGDRLATRLLMVGVDFRFGHGRRGDVPLLTALGRQLGFEVSAVPLVPVAPSRPDTACSSTWARELVARGEVEAAGLLLGRPHEVAGRVVGTSLPAPGRGVPTVVVRVGADRCLPTQGAYAGHLVGPDGRERAAGITVREGTTRHTGQLLDAHVPDRVRELMDQPVRARLLRRLPTTTPSHLLAEVQQADDVARQAQAATGWASWA